MSGRAGWSGIPELVAAHFGVQVLRAARLTDGMLNQSWRLSCHDHDRVLRIGRRERTADQVRYERRVARAWSEVVPQVVVAETDDVPVVEGRALTLFPFVDGDAGTGVDPVARTPIMAGVLARLHQASLDLELPQRPGFAAQDERPDWWRWPAARDLLAQRYHDDPELADAIRIVDDELQRLATLMDRWRTDGRLSLRATVHGDLNPRNQLFRDGQLVGVIDTDDCRVEPLVWEVAQTAYGDRTVPAADVWRWYREAGGPVPDHDQELLAPMARIGAMSELQWVLDLDDGSTPTLHAEGREQVLTIAGWIGHPIARDAGG
jgi:Ser/Thr protein kinase RdoA (MazF antagonist)